MSAEPARLVDGLRVFQTIHAGVELGIPAAGSLVIEGGIQ
jgi:hypothetical protein